MAMQTKSALELGWHANGLWGEVQRRGTHAEQGLQHVGAIVCQIVLFTDKRSHVLPTLGVQFHGLNVQIPVDREMEYLG